MKIACADFYTLARGRRVGDRDVDCAENRKILPHSHCQAKVPAAKALGGDLKAIDEAAERHIAFGIRQSGDIDVRGGQDFVRVSAEVFHDLAEADPGACSYDLSHIGAACGGMSPDNAKTVVK
jgi:hypothetical protein